MGNGHEKENLYLSCSESLNLNRLSLYISTVRL